MGQVRRSAWHMKIRNLPSETRYLALAELKDLHLKNSRLTVFDVNSDGSFPASAVSALCEFDATNQEYHTRQVEELRARTFQSFVKCDARLVVVEDLTPPLMEILGSSLDLEPAVFQRHVESSWISHSNSISSSYSSKPGSNDLCLTIPHPRLWEVYHPSAWRFAEWRSECLRRSAMHLQCRQVMPVYDVPEENKVQCTAFEHYTVAFQMNRNSCTKWRAAVFLPPSVREWGSGNLYIRKHLNLGININAFHSTDPRSSVRVEEPSESADPDVSSWLTALKLLSEDGADMRDHVNILESLWREALEHWNMHLVHISRAVDLVTGSPGLDDNDLLPQQQLRAVIYQGAALISDILNSIDATKETQAMDAAAPQGSKTNLQHDHPKQPRLDDLHRQFLITKTQLESKLPAIQHHIDIIRVKQQNRLAETQLEESRKAIQQADTIKRLTILAFIYIPIQTTASIFGMNLKELSPNPSVWTFVLVMVLLLAVTMSAAGWQHISNYSSRLRNVIFGSLRATVANALGSLGLNVHVEPRDTLQPNARITKPSWVV